MPVVTIHQVKQTLRNTIAYVTNPSKTLNGLTVSTSESMLWDMNAGQNSNITATTWAMLSDLEDGLKGSHAGRQNTNDGGKRLAQHIIQSFDPKDTTLTWTQVHEMGVEFAEKLTKGKFKYIVATHVDKQHLHNHIIICNRDETKQHRSFRTPRTFLAQARTLSDAIAIEHGVRVLPPSKGRTGRNIQEIYASMRTGGQLQLLRAIIGEASIRAASYPEFKSILAQHGVRVEARGRDLTYTVAGRKARGLTLGSAYGMEGVATRISGGGRLACVTANKSLVTHADANSVTLWVPGTHHREQATLPRRMATYDGKTWTVWLAPDDRIPLKDRSGQYTRTVGQRRLVESFGRTQTRWYEPWKSTILEAERLNARMTAKSEKQYRWLLHAIRNAQAIQDSIDTQEAQEKFGYGTLGMWKAEQEIGRLHDQWRKLMDDPALQDNPEELDLMLSDIEHKAALADHQRTLLERSRGKIKQEPPKFVPRVQRRRGETGWANQPSTQRQQAVFDSLYRQRRLSEEQRERLRHVSIAQASQEINRILHANGRFGDSVIGGNRADDSTRSQQQKQSDSKRNKPDGRR